MPRTYTLISNLPKHLEYIISPSFTELLVSFSFIYYITIFFILVRILIYFGVGIVNLVNTKHSSFVTIVRRRFFLSFFLKCYQIRSFKNIILQIAMCTCL